MKLSRAWLLLGLLVLACKREPPSIYIAPTTTASSSASSAVVAMVDASTPKLAPRYADALKRGRRATIDKRYDDAVAAFGEALTAQPNDARALAEKGYAELLAHKLRVAREDLLRASTTTEATLASQVWFNVGLVDEGLERSDDALVDYWFANNLHASQAAQKKIAGRTVCPIREARGRVAALHGSSWLDVARALFATGNEAMRNATPKTESAAKTALLDASAKPHVIGGQTFWIVHYGDLEATGATTAAIVQTSSSDYWTYNNIASRYIMNGMPVPDPPVAIDALGAVVHVATEEQAFASSLVLCEDPDGGDLFECTGDPTENAVAPALGRRLAPTSYIDFVIDPSSHALVWDLRDDASARFRSLSDGGRATTLSATLHEIELTGLGCDLKLHI